MTVFPIRFDSIQVAADKVEFMLEGKVMITVDLPAPHEVVIVKASGTAAIPCICNPSSASGRVKSSPEGSAGRL